MSESQWFIGVDFGLVADHTAVCVLERTEFQDDVGEIRPRHNIRDIRRIDLGTPYPEVCNRLAVLISKLPEGSFIAADATGVGRPVVEYLLHESLEGLGANLLAVVITGGVRPSGEGNVARVPKRELVLCFVTHLQDGTLTIEPEIKHAAILLEEMRQFRFRTTQAGNETYEAWREREHDDIVFAASLADWSATNYWTPIIPRPIKLTDKKVLGAAGEYTTLTLDDAWADHMGVRRRRRI